MGCLQSTEGDSSSRNKNKSTSDKSKQQDDDDHDAPENTQSTVADDELTEPRSFTFAELAAATEGFKIANLLGEGGFGMVYRGTLQDSHQIVAIKRMNRNRHQGEEEFDLERSTLRLLDHPNLVKLIGYCAEAKERLLVYEYMPLGSLDTHLHGVRNDRKPLDWNTRLKIATDAARALAYLHEEADPKIIYRDFKASNILLGEGFHVKLSDFGMVKEGPVGDQSHVSTEHMMGTYGYICPEYGMKGKLSFKSDVYSFGVVLLELITGRKAIDDTNSDEEKYLLRWARPFLEDAKTYPEIADPSLAGQYTEKGLRQAVVICNMCLRDDPKKRPSAAELVTALSYVASPNAPQHGEGSSGVKDVDEEGEEG